jgi:diacylglycerol O-acyltransferase
MPNDHQNNSLSWGDALFLYIEREGQPLNVGSVMEFEGVIPLKSCMQFVESKLALIPRYRQHVVFPPLNLGLPTWQSDPEFDIRNHIRQVTLRRGTEVELKTLASKILCSSLDRRRPLWDLTLVRGLQSNCTGLIVRIHHCLVDGVAGVGLMNVLMDMQPVAPPPPPKRERLQAEPQRDAGALLLDGLVKTYFSIAKSVLTVQSEVLAMAQEAVANPGGPLAELVRAMPDLASPTERLPFNVVCRGPQKFAWTQIPMAEIAAIRERCGGTFNDVILTVVTSAIRRYVEKLGVRAKGRMLRIVIPVNVRGEGELGEMGNRITFLPVNIPLDIHAPDKLLRVIRERMEILKHARAAELVGFVGSVAATIPTAMWALLGPIASQLPLSLCNLICTNVPGPQVPLYLMSHKMLSWYPYVPIGGEMGINCAILTYNGVAHFGFTGDVGAAPDLGRLEKFVNASFAELREAAAAAKQPPQKGQRKKAKIPLSTKPVRRRSGKASAAVPAPAEPASKSEPSKELEKALEVGA